MNNSITSNLSVLSLTVQINLLERIKLQLQKIKYYNLRKIRNNIIFKFIPEYNFNSMDEVVAGISNEIPPLTWT